MRFLKFVFCPLFCSSSWTYKLVFIAVKQYCRLSTKTKMHLAHKFSNITASLPNILVFTELAVLEMKVVRICFVVVFILVLVLIVVVVMVIEAVIVMVTPTALIKTPGRIAVM